VGMMEIGNQNQVLKVSMKRLYNMLQLGFLKMNTKYQLGRDDYCEFHGKEGHYIEDCIKFCQKVANMLILGELRIETMGATRR